MHAGVEATIHQIEIFVGVFVGAITFTGSVIAFGKLQGVIRSKPLLLPGGTGSTWRMLLRLPVLRHAVRRRIADAAAAAVDDRRSPASSASTW